ncbi:MAG: hypothetical protein CL675_04385 [Bdellovibrionaceae bacterium]|nr:hypothetical protein [Pseudobdellovibrionaceae bacterium]
MIKKAIRSALAATVFFGLSTAVAMSHSSVVLKAEGPSVNRIVITCLTPFCEDIEVYYTGPNPASRNTHTETDRIQVNASTLSEWTMKSKIPGNYHGRESIDAFKAFVADFRQNPTTGFFNSEDTNRFLILASAIGIAATTMIVDPIEFVRTHILDRLWLRSMAADVVAELTLLDFHGETSPKEIHLNTRQFEKTVKMLAQAIDQKSEVICRNIYSKSSRL